MNIGIIGYGYVGGAIGYLFKSITTPMIYDVDENKRTHSLEDIEKECEFIFICLPTPMNKDGSCDVSLIETYLTELENKTDAIIVIKSTIPPGTTNRFKKEYPKLRIVMNPEFLTEKNWKHDIITPSRIIIGGDSEDTIKIKELYEKVFMGYLIYEVDATTAELSKYAANTFLSTKVSFFNEIYDISKELDCCYDKVRTLVCLDPRIGNSHSYVPGHDGKRGFGGTCFPKDINALIKTAEELNIDPIVNKSVWEKNKKVRGI